MPLPIQKKVVTEIIDYISGGGKLGCANTGGAKLGRTTCGIAGMLASSARNPSATPARRLPGRPSAPPITPVCPAATIIETPAP